MKKILTLLIVFVTVSSVVFAASYDNNEYQRKSRMYTAMADRSYENGDYDNAVVYSDEADKYATLSEEYIKEMMARTEAEDLMNKARSRLTWAESVDAEKFFPDVYGVAKDAIEAGGNAFDAKEYVSAKEYAIAALDALTNVRDVDPLPKYYVVRSWKKAKHCFWTIAGYPYIFDNSFAWKKLYEANKDKIPNPSNPNLILPGTVLTIPSVNGEYREGTFDPSKKYDPLEKPVKE